MVLDTAAEVEGNVAEPEVSLEVTPPETPEVEAPEEAPPVAPETVKPDYSSLLADAPEDELLQTPKMRDILARREESIRRRTETDLQRRASSDENVKAILTSALKQAVESGDEAGISTAAQQALLWNRWYQAQALAQELPVTLMRSYNIPSEVQAKALELRGTDPERPDIDKYLATLIRGAVDVELAEARKADEAKLKQAISDGVAAELKAKQIETAPKLDVLQTLPLGQPAGTSGMAITTMSDADEGFATDRISFQEYKRYREQFGVGSAPGGR